MNHLILKINLLCIYYDYIADNGAMPYIEVDTTINDVNVPDSHIKDDNSIVLNISDRAVRNLNMGDDNENIIFDAVFDECEFYNITIPVGSVIMIFDPDPESKCYSNHYGFAKRFQTEEHSDFEPKTADIIQLW